MVWNLIWIVACLGTAAQAQVAVPIPSKDSLREANGAMRELLRPWNDDTRAVKLEFRAIQFAPVRVRLVAHYALPTHPTHFDFQLRSLSYRGQSVKDAEIEGRGTVRIDWLKALGQSRWDQWTQKVQDELQDRLEETLKQYGKAARVKLTVSDVKMAKDGQVQSFEIEAQAKIDVSQISSPRLRAGLLFQKFKVTAQVDRGGLDFQFFGRLNAQYSGSQDASHRLTEFLQQLLSLDVAALQHIVDVVKYFDAWVHERLGGH